MGDFWHAFQALGVDAVQPLILLGLLSLAPIVMFWIIRSMFLERVAFGTELFGLLFASDFMVTLGFVEAWWLSGCAESPNWLCQKPSDVMGLYRSVSGISLVLLLYASLLACMWERHSEDDREEREVDNRRSGAIHPAEGTVEIDHWWLRVLMLKWVLVTFHLWWITKLSKLRLLVTL
jgi:hypothetical protein